jgi:hypothetical protein
VAVDAGGAVHAIAIKFVEMSLLNQEGHHLHSEADNLERTVRSGAGTDKAP